MLTVNTHPENVYVCDMREGKKSIPIFWNPKKNGDLKNKVEDLDAFFTPHLRDRFELSQEQANIILSHVKAGTVPISLQTKFFKVKKFIDESLYSEMDINDSANTFEINFPPGADTWPSNTIIAGATSSGKTYHTKERILRNLNGPKKDRRRFLWFSSEWNTDKTLKELKKDKYREYLRGTDISDSALNDSDHANAKEFFAYEVELACENAIPGTVFIFDDPVDSAEGLQAPIRHLINKSLRVSRHKQNGLIFILHRIRSGAWSVQGHNSCKFFTLFPRSQKGKCIQFLNQDMGLTLREARRMVADFGASGRAMTVQLFAPNLLIGDKLIRLI